jgi:hypothetical protein
MPDMGHGSIGNVQPTHLSDGEYAGSAHLSMDGGIWTVTFGLSRGDAVLGELVYTIDL